MGRIIDEVQSAPAIWGSANLTAEVTMFADAVARDKQRDASVGPGPDEGARDCEAQTSQKGALP